MSYKPSNSAITLAIILTKSHDLLIRKLEELQNLLIVIIKAIFGNPKDNTFEVRLSTTIPEVLAESVLTSNRHELKVFRFECATNKNSISDVIKRQNFNNQNSNLINLICCHHVF
ncbi:MAG: hypothetical protein H7Z18_09535 [Methylophilaceae bacterium]|nr:hypothetical protein [Methylophilaceae bacterium]